MSLFRLIRLIRSIRRWLPDPGPVPVPPPVPTDEGKPMTSTVLYTLALKAWPAVVGVATFIVYANQGDWPHALAAVGLGSAASFTSHLLHLSPPPPS